ncbi:hypothetical protein AIZ10_23250, partial [Salmonella enterica subsp. enterica serovar Typhimurium]
MYKREVKGSRFVRLDDFCKKHKFVADYQSQGKLPAQRLDQTMRDRYQKLIADIMTIRVIKGLTAIQLHYQKRERRVFPNR